MKLTPRQLAYAALSLAALAVVLSCAVFLVVSHAEAARVAQRQNEATQMQREFGQSQAAPGSKL